MALSAFFGGWCLQNYEWQTDSLMFVLGLLSLSASGGLVFYLIYFLKKTKGFGLLGLTFITSLMLMEQKALACSVCQFGTPDSPLVLGIRSGIWILLFLVASVLVGFFCLFLFWAKRDTQANLNSPR